MSNWTDADTEALAAVAGDVERHCDFPDVGEDALLTRAADEITRLQARVVELELEVSATMQASQRRDAERMELCGNMATMRRRIAALEAERAEVAGVLRRLINRIDFLASTEGSVTMRDEAVGWCRDWVARLERKDTDG